MQNIWEDQAMSINVKINKMKPMETDSKTVYVQFEDLIILPNGGRYLWNINKQTLFLDTESFPHDLSEKVTFKRLATVWFFKQWKW